MDEITIIGDAFVCGFDEWMDIWGDPLLSGTIFMLSYGITALLIFRAARGSVTREGWYWRLCGVLFLFQLVNTHLDLHAMVWTTGRCLARAQDWYEYRREIQIIFLICIGLILAAFLLIVLILFLRDIFGNFLLTLGASIALGFTIVKSINYHHLESIYGAQAGLFYVADYIEFSGIALAFLAAVIKLRQNRITTG